MNTFPVVLSKVDEWAVACPTVNLNTKLYFRYKDTDTWSLSGIGFQRNDANSLATGTLTIDGTDTWSGDGIVTNWSAPLDWASVYLKLSVYPET